jgi:hypothetical protein
VLKIEWIPKLQTKKFRKANRYIWWLAFPDDSLTFNLLSLEKMIAFYSASADRISKNNAIRPLVIISLNPRRGFWEC